MRQSYGGHAWSLRAFGICLDLKGGSWPLALVRTRFCLCNLEMNGNDFCLGSESGVRRGTLGVPGRAWKMQKFDGVVECLENFK